MNQLTNVIDTPPQTWDIMRQQAQTLLMSGFLPSSIKKPEQAIAIMLKGREIGIPAMQALSQINVIQGKPTVSAELMMALIYRSFPDAKINFEQLDDKGCVILAQRPGGKFQRFAFTETDAKAAQLLSKDNWKKYPRAMYRSRAVSEMARSLFPDALMGCSYTPEELGASVNDDGEVISIEVEPEQKPKAKHDPQKIKDMQNTESQEMAEKALNERRIKLDVLLSELAEQYGDQKVLDVSGLKPGFKLEELTGKDITAILIKLKPLLNG